MEKSQDNLKNATEVDSCFSSYKLGFTKVFEFSLNRENYKLIEDYILSCLNNLFLDFKAKFFIVIKKLMLYKSLSRLNMDESESHFKSIEKCYLLLNIDFTESKDYLTTFINSPLIFTTRYYTSTIEINLCSLLMLILQSDLNSSEDISDCLLKLFQEFEISIFYYTINYLIKDNIDFKLEEYISANFEFPLLINMSKDEKNSKRKKELKKNYIINN